MSTNNILDAIDRPYESNPFKLISPSIEAFQIMAVEWLKLFGITLLALLIASVPGIIGAVSISQSKINLPGIALILLSAIIIVFVSMYISYAFNSMLLSAGRGVKIPWKESLPNSVSKSWGLFLTSLLAGIIILGGLIAFVVPGVFFALWYSQAGYVVVDEGITGMKALQRSKFLVRKRLVDTFGLNSMLQIMLQLIGVIPFVGSFGSFIISLVTMPLLPIRYLQLKQLDDENRDLTTTNIWNFVFLYVAIGLLALILIGLVVAILTGTNKH